MRTDIFHAKPHAFPGSSYTGIFDEYGEIAGNSDKITTELAMSLGRALSAISDRIAVGHSDCTLCHLLAGAFVSGAAAQGAHITELGKTFFAANAYLARALLFKLSVFFENDGHRLRIRITDKTGLPIDKELCEVIEDKLSSPTDESSGLSDAVMPKSIASEELFVSEVSQKGALSGFEISVSGETLATKALIKTLLACGCKISPSKHGICELSVSDDGTKLFIQDERGYLYDDSHVKAAGMLIFFRRGGKALATHADAPAISEQIAHLYGGRIYRSGRDSVAREIYLSQEILCNAISDAVAFLIYLKENSLTAETLFSLLPDFTLVSREFICKGNRKKLLRNLKSLCHDMHSENTHPLRICTDGGWVSISSSGSANTLRITSEGMNEEIASELCNLFVEKASIADKEGDK